MVFDNSGIFNKHKGSTDSYGILCKLREWSVIARDYRIFHSKLVGINKAKKMTALKIERRTKLNTNYFA